MFYVIHIEGDPGNASLRGSPLSLRGCPTRDEAKAAINWQAAGGYDRRQFVVATVDPDLPGVMTTDDGRPVLIMNNVWTHGAFAGFIVDLWGHLSRKAT